MENKIQDSKMWEDLKQAINNLTKEDLYNYISDTMVFPEEWDANLASEISKAREEGRKEKDIASDFLYWHPLGGGMPDSSIRIGVEFEVGGCHEDWGFVIEQNGKTISSGRTLKEAISKLKTKEDEKR